MTASPKKRLIPVPNWPEHHDYPSIAGLRWLIFHKETNGFNTVVKKIGRRVLIDEDAYFAWVEAQQQKEV
jgi:hypothetical protein